MATEESSAAANVETRRTQPLGALIAELERQGLLRFVLAAAAPTASVAISGLTLDSRRVEKGTLFAALSGQHVDGMEFVEDAVTRGAAAVLAERASPNIGVPQLLVPAGRPALALAAAWFNGYPSESLGIVGITGTDGKTTTSYLVRSILGTAGHPTGLIGTIDVVAGGESLGNAARATSPESPELQSYLA